MNISDKVTKFIPEVSSSKMLNLALPLGRYSGIGLTQIDSTTLTLNEGSSFILPFSIDNSIVVRIDSDIVFDVSADSVIYLSARETPVGNIEISLEYGNSIPSDSLSIGVNIGGSVVNGSINSLGSGGSSVLLTDYFIDTDLGNDSNSGSDYANAWKTMAPLTTIPFGRIHFRGSVDTPSIEIKSGEFTFIRDGVMTGRLGKINIRNTKLRLGEAFFSPDETLLLTALNADFNNEVVINTEMNWLPQSDNVFRINNNSKLQINDTQFVEGAINGVLTTNLNSSISILSGVDIVDAGGASATNLVAIGNNSHVFLGNQQIGSTITVTGFHLSVQVSCQLECTPYGGVLITDYPSQSIHESAIIRGWEEYPYNRIEECISTEVSTSGTGVIGALLPVDVSGGAATISPPANPRTGAKFSVVASRGDASVNNITLDFVTATQNFRAVSQNDVISSNDYVAYTFIDPTVGWVR